MPTIARIGAIQIRLYYDDHGVPHFHAVTSDFDFKFTIAHCSVVSGTGRIRGRDLAVIRSWAEQHRAMLQLNWQLARDSEPLRDIED